MFFLSRFFAFGFRFCEIALLLYSSREYIYWILVFNLIWPARKLLVLKTNIIVKKQGTGYVGAIERFLAALEKVVETHMSVVYLGSVRRSRSFKELIFFFDMRPLVKRKMSANENC